MLAAAKALARAIHLPALSPVVEDGAPRDQGAFGCGTTLCTLLGDTPPMRSVVGSGLPPPVS